MPALLRFPDRQMAPARVLCIGRNYALHIEEMHAARPEAPVVFMKPSSSLVDTRSRLCLPRRQGAVHHELELVVALGEGGRDIDAARAPALIAGLTLGLDLTLRDVQSRLKAAGQPWELAKAFDGSAVIGDFVDFDPALHPLDRIEMRCRVNGELRQQGTSGDMLFPVPALIAYLSQHWALQPGDLIFTGTPAGVGPLVVGDTIALESPMIGAFAWTCE